MGAVSPTARDFVKDGNPVNLPAADSLPDACTIRVGYINQTTDVVIVAYAGDSIVYAPNKSAASLTLTEKYRVVDLVNDITGGRWICVDVLTDLAALTPTDDYAVIGNGTSWESRALVEADISDFGTYETADADILKADTPDVLTAGFSASDHAAGTKDSGTYTPDPDDGNFQVAVNGGAHTLAPPSASCNIIIHYTNNGSAGAITTSGFTLVDGDSFTTTDGHEFLCYITKINDVSHLNVKALQ